MPFKSKWRYDTSFLLPAIMNMTVFSLKWPNGCINLENGLLYCQYSLLKDQIILLLVWGHHGRFLGSTCDKTAENFRICLVSDFVKPLKIWVHSDNFYFHIFKERTLWKNPKNLLKPGQNQKGQNFFLAAPFFESFGSWENGFKKRCS